MMIMQSAIICPQCGIRIMLSFQNLIDKNLDFRISLIQIKGILGVSIYKTITSTTNNKKILHDFCINSWKHYPFIAKIEQTTSYHNVITEFIRQGLLDPVELQ